MNRQVVLFENSSGETPVRDFVKRLSAKEQQKVAWGLKILEEGFPLKEPYFKKIVGHEGLWELRVTFGGNAFRIYFFEMSKILIVALIGHQKNDEKEQRREIEIASQYMKEAKEQAK